MLLKFNRVFRTLSSIFMLLKYKISTAKITSSCCFCRALKSHSFQIKCAGPNSPTPFKVNSSSNNNNYGVIIYSPYYFSKLYGFLLFPMEHKIGIYLFIERKKERKKERSLIFYKMKVNGKRKKKITMIN